MIHIMKITIKMGFLLLILFPVCMSLCAQESISLSGTWRFCPDEKDEGIRNNWQTRLFEDIIILPGTTDEAKYGIKTTDAETGYLTREYKYIGTAWYQRDIDIPVTWKDRRVLLEFERVMWESLVYVDNRQISKKDALNSSHRHDLGFLTPGNTGLRCV